MNKRRKLIKALELMIVLCVAIIVISVVLFKKKDVSISKDEFASKEELIEWYGFTEEDIKEIDLDRVLEEFPWLYSDFENNTSKEVVLNRFKKFQGLIDEYDARQKHLEEVSLEYLVTADEYEGELPNFNEIKYFAYSVQNELYIYSYLFDFDKSIAYGFEGQIPVYVDYTVANTVVFLSEENKKEFMNALKAADFESWKHRYGSKMNDAVWNIGMEFNDGTVISYSGISGEKGYPEAYLDLYNDIQIIIGNSERDMNTLSQLEYTDDEIYFDINLYKEEFSLGRNKRHIRKNGNLTEKEKEDIIQLMSNGKVHEWEQFEIGIDDYEWSLVLTYKDNYKVYYGKPQDYDEVINSIIDILNNHQE